MKKNKLLKRIIASLSAVVIAACVMVTNASAATMSWSIYRKRSSSEAGAPYVTKSRDAQTYTPVVTFTYYTANCTTWESDADSSGEVQYAITYAKRSLSDTRPYPVVISSDYYFKKKTTSNVRLDLKEPVVYGENITIYFDLASSPSVICNFGGTFYLDGAKVVQ